MSHTSRNFVLAYVLLVGLPLLGLIGILKTGRSLIAPVSVDGLWQLHVDPVQIAAVPCGRTLIEDAADGALLISQSGKRFTLSFSHGPKSPGMLDGNKLNGSFVAPAGGSGESACDEAREFSIVATVDSKTTPRSMDGTLSIEHCPACAGVGFHGVRQAPSLGRETR